MIYIRVKRVIDIVVSLFAILLLLPLYAIISIVVKIDSPGPIIFKQKRSGINKKVFTVYKFRTMRTETPKYCATRDLKNRNYYVTNVGHFLRKTSLDEIPQLFNILKGDMSFIGPRPVVITETDLIDEREKYGVNDIMPGLTGYAQVNGRDDIGVKRKAKLDAYYKKHINLLLDMSIFFKTIFVVLKKDGIKAKDTRALSVNIRVDYVLIDNNNLIKVEMLENKHKSLNEHVAK